MTDLRSDSAVALAWETLHEVLDPEIGLDVVELGLVYDVESIDGTVVVTMTLTTAGCPVAESLPCEAQTVLASALGPGTPVDVRLVWDPPWTPAMISADAARRLGYRGR